MIILASSSPRRKELLKQIVDEFIILVPNIDESIDRPQKVEEIPYELAYRKAKEISKSHFDYHLKLSPFNENKLYFSKDQIDELNNFYIN